MRAFFSPQFCINIMACDLAWIFSRAPVIVGYQSARQKWKCSGSESSTDQAPGLQLT